jgi:hypothetical protein
MIDPNDKFPTTWTPTPYKFVEPKKKSRGGQFLVCVFVGAVIGLFLSVVIGANIWLPAGIIATFIMYAVIASNEKSS